MVDAPSSAFAANRVLGALISPPRFEIGQVIGRSFGLFRHNAILYLPLVALVLIVRSVAPITGFTPVQWSVFGGLFVLPFAWFFYGAMTRTMMNELLGEKPGFLDGARAGLVYLPLLAVINTAQVLAIALGLVLLIVPGVILVTVLWTTPAIAVSEGTGFVGTFRRAFELTRNHRWSILGTLFIIGLLNLPIRVATYVANQILLSALPLDGRVWSALTVNPIAQMAQQLLVLAALVSTYYELRRIKGGFGANSTAAVFD
jgi:hypothetical protein